MLTRSLPIIAIQLDALTVDGKLLLHFTKVLDLYEAPEGPADQVETAVDRRYWEARSSPAAMQLFDHFVRILSESSIPVKLNWRQDGIALAGKWNFASITPRKAGHCLLKFYRRLPEDVLNEAHEKLEAAGTPIRDLSADRFSIRLDRQVLDRAAPVLTELVKQGVELEAE